MSDDKEYNSQLEQKGLSKTTSVLGQGFSDALKVGASAGSIGALSTAIYYRNGDKENIPASNDKEVKSSVEKIKTASSNVVANIKNGSYWKKLTEKSASIYKNLKNGTYLQNTKQFAANIKSGVYIEKAKEAVNEVKKQVVKDVGKQLWKSLSVGKKSGIIGVASGLAFGAGGFVVGAFKGAKKFDEAKEQFNEITNENKNIKEKLADTQNRLAASEASMAEIRSAVSHQPQQQKSFTADLNAQRAAQAAQVAQAAI